MKRIIFILSLFLIVGAACKSEEAVQADKVSINRFELQACLDQTEKNYLAEKEMLCQSQESSAAQRLADCKKLYYPWMQQGIDRDQYCRNTTVETREPDENYKNCMLDLDPNIKIAFDACVGYSNDQLEEGCVLAGNIKQELENNRDKEQEECYNLYRN